jgi:trk system potassium uptake protein TrkA
VRKVLAINNEMEYYKLMHSLGIVVVRGPQMAAYHRIVETIHSNRVLLERKYCGGEGTVFLRRVLEGGPLCGKVLRPLRLEGVRLLVVREEAILAADDAGPLMAEDLICAFASGESIQRVEQWFDEL